MVGFNFSFGICYLMVKMAIIFHIPESEIIRTYFHVVRPRSHEIRLNDDIYRYFRVSLSITSEA